MTPEEINQDAIAIDKLVRRAVALIKPKANRRDACRLDVEGALIEIEFMDAQLRSGNNNRTKLTKQATRRLARALRHLETVLKDKNLDVRVQLFFPRTELSKWTAHRKDLVNTPSGKLKRAKAVKKRHAIGEAHLLMLNYAGPNAAKNTSRGSTFCRLAAVLFGKPAEELHNQCKEALRKKRGQR